MTKRATVVAKEYLSMMRNYHVSAYASSIAFFTYLSLAPLVFVFFYILPYTPLTEAKLIELLTEFFPQALSPMIVTAISKLYDSSPGTFSVTLLVLLWASGKGMLALLRGMNNINKVEEKRNYILLRLRASIYTFLLLVIVVFLLVLVVFGERIAFLLTQIFPQIHYLFDALFRFRPLFMILVLTLFLGAVYTWLPNRKNLFKFELPGAFLGGILWYVASWLFSEYVNRFFSFDVYGSVATVAIVMLWLYICFYIVLAGALMNKFLMPAMEYVYELVRKKK